MIAFGKRSAAPNGWCVLGKRSAAANGLLALGNFVRPPSYSFSDLFFDDFNRADGALGANWVSNVASPGVGVFSNQARTLGVAYFGVKRYGYLAEGTPADVAVSATTTYSETNDRAGLFARVTGFSEGEPTGGYRLKAQENYTELSFNGTVIADHGGVGMAALLRLECVGDSIKVYSDGDLFIDITHTGNLEAGYCGFWSYIGSGATPAYVCFDDFKIEAAS